MFRPVLPSRSALAVVPPTEKRAGEVCTDTLGRSRTASRRLVLWPLLICSAPITSMETGKSSLACSWREPLTTTSGRAMALVLAVPDWAQAPLPAHARRARAAAPRSSVGGKCSGDACNGGRAFIKIKIVPGDLVRTLIMKWQAGATLAARAHAPRARAAQTTMRASTADALARSGTRKENRPCPDSPPT